MKISFDGMCADLDSAFKSFHGVFGVFGLVATVGNCLWNFATSDIFPCQGKTRYIMSKELPQSTISLGTHDKESPSSHPRAVPFHPFLQYEWLFAVWLLWTYDETTMQWSLAFEAIQSDVKEFVSYVAPSGFARARTYS
jgi:hypothetical protein